MVSDLDFKGLRRDKIDTNRSRKAKLRLRRAAKDQRRSSASRECQRLRKSKDASLRRLDIDEEVATFEHDYREFSALHTDERKKDFSRWYTAQALAEVTASLHSEEQHMPQAGQSWYEKILAAAAKALRADLPFDKLRTQFLKDHGEQILFALGEWVGARISLRPAPVDSCIQEQFMAYFLDCFQLIPAFHGTRIQNFGSIFSKGLLVPGQESGIAVANGNADGVGIYLAKLTNAGLSVSFSQPAARKKHRTMLVCGVIDDSKAGANDRARLDFPGPQFPKVKHVRDALVVNRKELVVPLFIASWSPESWERNRMWRRQMYHSKTTLLHKRIDREVNAYAQKRASWIRSNLEGFTCWRGDWQKWIFLPGCGGYTRDFWWAVNDPRVGGPVEEHKFPMDRGVIKLYRLMRDAQWLIDAPK